MSADVAEDAFDPISFEVDGSISRACTPASFDTIPSTRPPTTAATASFDTRAITPWSLPDTMPLTPTLCKAVSQRRSATTAGDASGKQPIRVQLINKAEPVYKPQGQGPFKKAWVNRTTSLNTPAQILAERSGVTKPQHFTAPSANTKITRKFGNDTGRHGERRVSTPGFARYSGRDSSYGSWLGLGVDRNDTPGPGRYIANSPKRKLRSRTPQGSSAGLQYAAGTWGRAARATPIDFVHRDFDLQSEFGGRTDLNCVRRTAQACTMGGVPPSETRLAGTGPGPGVYYPSIDFARKDGCRPKSFSKSSRSDTMDLVPQAKDLKNAGPKYAVWDLPTYKNTCGYGPSQSTWSRADWQSKAVYRFGTRDLQERSNQALEPVG